MTTGALHGPLLFATLLDQLVAVAQQSLPCALIASGISRLISAPLYPALARLQLLRLGVPLEPEKKGAHHTR